MDTLNPILNALVQDLVRQLTPVVVQAIAGELEDYKLQTDQKISDALDVSRNWVREVVGEILDEDLRGRIADVVDDDNFMDGAAMAARVIDNLDMSDLAEKVFEEVNLTDLAEKVVDEIDLEDKIKEFFNDNSFSVSLS
jgi:hypothetical protein